MALTTFRPGWATTETPGCTGIKVRPVALYWLSGASLVPMRLTPKVRPLC
jgi:hypothetical protein